MVMSAPERMSEGEKTKFMDWIKGLSLRQVRLLIKVLQIEERFKDSMDKSELEIYQKKSLGDMLHINGVVG